MCCPFLSTTYWGSIASRLAICMGIRMKKVKIFIVMSLIITSSLLLFTGCENSLHMDADKCAEVALEYLENKYQTEFEVLDSGEKRKYIGSAGYAKVIVNNKFEDNENRYVVTVYPDGSSDEDKDGYYDSYKVVSDDYMSYLLQDYVKNDLDKLLMDAGLTRFISSVSIEEMGEVDDGFSEFLGFSVDFLVQSEESFSLINILDNHRISMHCWLEIPESEYSDTLQNDIANIIEPLLSDDLISFGIEIYYNEHYDEVEKLDKNNIGRNVVGDKSIYFSVKEEKKNESR